MGRKCFRFLWGSRSLGFTGTGLSVQGLSVQDLQFTGVGSRSLVFSYGCQSKAPVEDFVYGSCRSIRTNVGDMIFRNGRLRNRILDHERYSYQSASLNPKPQTLNLACTGGNGERKNCVRHHAYLLSCGGFPTLRVPFWGVPINRIIVFLGQY